METGGLWMNPLLLVSRTRSSQIAYSELYLESYLVRDSKGLTKTELLDPFHIVRVTQS